MNIHELMKSHREKLGYTQEELASQLYVSRQAVSKWERGEATPDIDNIIRISDIYDVSIDELIRGSRFFPKPYKTKEQRGQYMKYIGFVFGLCLFAFTMSVMNPLFSILCTLLFAILVKLMTVDRYWVFTRKGIQITTYKKWCDRLRSNFNKDRYLVSIPYEDIQVFKIKYVKLSHYAQIQKVQIDRFFMEIVTDRKRYRLPIWPQTQKDLPMLCDYLNRKGIEIEDDSKLIDVIIQGKSVFEAMYKTE